MDYKTCEEIGEHIPHNSFDPEKTIRDYILKSPDLEEYKRICDEVYEFDLDHDAADAIDYVWLDADESKASPMIRSILPLVLVLVVNTSEAKFWLLKLDCV